MPLPDVEIEVAAQIADALATLDFELPYAITPLGEGAWQVRTVVRKHRAERACERSQQFSIKRVPPTERWFGLYDQAYDALLRYGLHQPRLFRSRDGSPISAGGLAVYEFLPGRPVSVLNDQQFDRHIRYLADYLKALGTVPVEHFQRSESLWSKPFSLDYLEHEFESAMVNVAPEVREIALAARREIVARRAELAAVPARVVHTDIGPGNIIFRKNVVAGIVDFTPELMNHVYALCVSLFWHCVNDGVDFDRIKRGFRLYSRRRPVSAEESALFSTYLLYATAYRLFVRILAGYPVDALSHIAGRTREVMALQW
jgi:Ser/Thr protein kinase RdoA (MazF antagonist)